MGLRERLWPGAGSRTGLAFTEQRVDLYQLVHDGEFERQSLPLKRGVLRASAREPNLQAPSELARRCLEAFGQLQTGSAVLLLPDLSVSASMVDRPGAGSELISLSGLTNDRLVMDWWSYPGGGTLGVCAPRAVVSQYEAVRDALGLNPGWIDTQSGALLPRLASRPEHRSDRLSCEIQLYPAHYSMALFQAGRLLDFRRRLRTVEDATAPLDELDRQRQLLGEPSLGCVGISGSGASELAGRLHAELGDGRVRFDDDDSRAAQAIWDLIARA